MTKLRGSGRRASPAEAGAVAGATAARAHGRALTDFPRRSRAENVLLASCARGEVAIVSDRRPDKSASSNRIRASFIRFLALGGDEQAPVHERGVVLFGAWIAGALDFEAAKIEVPLKILNCRLERIDASNASLRFLSLAGSSLKTGLRADQLRCAGHVFLRDGFCSKGEINLPRARIEGDLDCSASVFENPPGNALMLDGAVISGGLFLNKKFESAGEVRLLNAKIGSDFTCCGGTFKNASGEALSFDGAEIGGNVYLNHDFRALGTVRLLGAAIKHDLACGGHFDNPAGNALMLDRAIISGGLSLNATFEAAGEVRLLNAKIGGDLTCSGGTFKNAAGDALSLDNAEIGGNVYLNDEFQAIGAVRIVGVTIKGDLDCSRGRFSKPGSKAIILDHAQVVGRLLFRSVAQVEGQLDLSLLQVGSLCDDAESWTGHEIVLDGFTYTRFAGVAPTAAGARRAWLESQIPKDLGAEFRPQPWEQLISVLRTMGHPNEARAIAIAKQTQLRKARRIIPWTSWLHWLYGFTVGYGYRPVRVLIAVPLLWFLYGLLYWAAVTPFWVGEERLLAPVDSGPAASCLASPPVGRNGVSCPNVPPDYANFSPFIYSADVLLPVIDLGYQGQWQPVVSNRRGERVTLGWWLRYLYWAEIVLGWLGGGLLAAVITGLVKKD